VVEASNRVGGILGAGLVQPIARRIEAASRLLGQTQLEQGWNIVGMAGKQRFELGDRLLMLADSGIGSAKLPAGVPVSGAPAGLLGQLRDPAVVVAAVPVGNLEVRLRHLHLRIELERAGELGDGLFDQSFLIVENAEVVVGPGVGGVDPTGKRAEHREVALR
jgi:hypothetical protein